ncbi:TQO small subunit DoxD [Yinghuangia soli]|uniref:DoxX family membrane protein n=1 Tax=Yinghuangia soli TaxID=2908204 RepID=A0AA41U2A1_9ACTN|nr:TQO small subunit DoxD [Yinghuangia soli]MCF2526904.1 DoxX family membrane protein [Yinghuangia soli]
MIGPPPTAREPQVPGQRGAFRADPAEVTAELPRVDPGADPPTTALPRVRERPVRPASRTSARAGARTSARPAAAKQAPAAPVKGGPLQPGMFLLPLRIFLGAAFLLEGLRKLYDPAFLDPDAADSFAHRIDVLHDGSLFPPVLDLAAQHAISVGLLFAFGQVVVGVGALLGLWTRAMGMVGMLLSLGVLIAVGTSSSPYHAAYVVFLAAWSPLALAGAPMYSVDCWLSLRNWRGPLTLPVRARRRKLGYGSIIAGSGVGLTLLAGALFGHPTAPDTTVTGPGEAETTVTGPPSGAPAPQAPGAAPAPAAPSAPAVPSPSASAGKAGTGTPSAAPKTTGAKAPGETPATRRPAATTAGNNAPAASASQPKPSAAKPANAGGTIGGTPLGGLLGG